MIEQISKELFQTIVSTSTSQTYNPCDLQDMSDAVYFRDHVRDCVFVLPSHDVYYEQLTTRNKPLISIEEQSILKHARIVIAGQGTVGGNLTIALIRQGFENLVIADNDTFDVTNLNRQLCDLTSVGISKSQHIALTAKRINPFAKIEVKSEITTNNMEDFTSGADVIISALDNPRIIIALNQMAQETKLPLVMGTDLGSKVLLDVFDYRQKITLLNGRLGKLDPAMLTDEELVTKIVGVSNVPVEMLQAAILRFRGEIDYFAQTIVSAQLCTSMLVEAIKSIVLKKSVKKKSSIDLISVIRPNTVTWKRRLNWLGAAIELNRTLSQPQN